MTCAIVVRKLLVRRIVAALGALTCSACGLASLPRGATPRPVVVAAENTWGSIAAQLAGDRAQVVSIVRNPSGDPHDYEPTPGDARLIAQSRYVICNGAGYDDWCRRLVEADPEPRRLALDVSGLLGVRAGENPHVWYAPAYVLRAVDRIGADLARIDPGGVSYYAARRTWFTDVALRAYRDTVAAISARHGGTRIGATESIAAYLASGAGLDLITPASFLRAVSEGDDPSVSDRARMDRDIASHAIAVLIVNVQNSTPAVQTIADQARARGIPVVDITETLSPARATFQQWQTAQLRALLRALGG